MKPDGLESPVGPVLSQPRSRGDRVRIALTAVAVVILLAAGIGLAGNGARSSPSVSPPGGSASAARGAVASARSTAGTPTSLPLPPPTKDAGLGCAPVRLGVAPEIRLGASLNDPQAVRGIGLPARPNRLLPTARASGATGPSPQPPAWPAVSLASALQTPRDATLHLRAEQDACVRYVVAEYVPAAPERTIPFPIAFRTLNISPPASDVTLGSLPGGDWIVRVVAYFSTGTAGQENGTLVERFFRVINAPSAGPIPTPAITPAAPCAPLPTNGPVPSLELTGTVRGPVDGSAGTAPIPVQLGEPIEVRVVGDTCAIAWQILAQPPLGFMFDAQQDNPANDPFLFAQNRWFLPNLATGIVQVTATVRFLADVAVTGQWTLDVRGAAVPAVRLAVPDGTSVIAERQPCGASWRISGGTGGYEYCTADPAPESIPILSVSVDTPVTIEVPGWTIVSWAGSCGQTDRLTSPGRPFTLADGCDLGGWFSQGGSPPLPAAFLPRVSGPVIRIHLEAARGTTTVALTVYAEITVMP